MDIVGGVLSGTLGVLPSTLGGFKGVPVFIYIHSRSNQVIIWENKVMRWDATTNSLHSVMKDDSLQTHDFVIQLSPETLEVIKTSKEDVLVSINPSETRRLMRTLGCEEKLVDVVWFHPDKKVTSYKEKIVYTSLDLFRALYYSRILLN